MYKYRIVNNFLSLMLILFISCTENPPTENSGLKIEGKVISKGGAVSNALVELNSSSQKYTKNTNDSGEFIFTDIDPNTYDLSVTVSTENQNYKQVLETDITGSINLGDLTFEKLSYIVGNVDLSETEDDRLAEVFLLGTGINALTDSRGDYKLLYIPPGTYDIMVQKEGFISKDSIGIEIGVNEVDTINFELRPVVSGSATIDKTITLDRNLSGICVAGNTILGVNENNVFTIDTLNGTTQLVNTFHYETYEPALSDIVFYPDYQLAFCRTADFSPYSYFIDAESYKLSDSVNYSSADMQGAFYSEGYLYATEYDTDVLSNRVFKYNALDPSQNSYIATVDSLNTVYDMLLWNDRVIVATGKHNGKNMFATLDKTSFLVTSRYYIPEDRTIYRIEKINNALWGTDGWNNLIRFNIQIE